MVGRYLCASPGDCDAETSKKEESKLWDYAPFVLAAWCAPSISCSRLPQVRKQLWISSPRACETQDGILSLLYMGNRSRSGPYWGGGICSHLVCGIALCKATGRRSLLWWASLHIQFPSLSKCLLACVRWYGRRIKVLTVYNVITLPSTQHFSAGFHFTCIFWDSRNIILFFNLEPSWRIRCLFVKYPFSSTVQRLFLTNFLTSFQYFLGHQMRAWGTQKPSVAVKNNLLKFIITEKLIKEA